MRVDSSFRGEPVINLEARSKAALLREQVRFHGNLVMLLGSLQRR
jgi:hypothetical protein